MLTKIFIVQIFFIFTVSKCFSDSTDTNTIQAVDTVLFHQQGLLENTIPVTNPDNFEKELYQNPTAALFKSMLLPGWGQVGNRRYIKATLLMTLDAWFIASAIHHGRIASDFRNRYEEATDISARNDYYGLYLDRKDNRNKFTWFAVIVSFVSMFDAYVDAHLSGYPKREDNDNIKVEIIPINDNGINASITWSF